jgi:hypothetical protein
MRLEKCIKSIIRQAKINNALGKQQYVNHKLLDAKLYKAVKYASRFGIITGSVALRVAGFINRRPSDIDVHISREDFERYVQKSHATYMYRYRENTMDKCPEYLGFFIYKNFYIDFFESDASGGFTDSNGVEYASVPRLLNMKMDLVKDRNFTRRKDWDDLCEVCDIWHERIPFDSSERNHSILDVIGKIKRRYF